MRLGHALEIGRVIIRGEGIFLPTEFGDQFREIAFGVFLCALEHQMFEEMRNAGFARRIIRRTIAIPHHMRDDRRAMIRDHHDFHAIVEAEMGNGGPCAAGSGWAGSGREADRRQTT